MKGFEICYIDKTTKIAIKDGLIVIDLYNNNSDRRMYIGGVDYKECKRIVWYDNSPIKIGDKFKIKVTEIDDPSAPVEITEDKNIKRPKTKLEFFRELEVELKKQGLI
jgi:hypothetical protein